MCDIVRGVGRTRLREAPVIIVRVHQRSEGKGFDVVDADRSFGAFLGLGEGGEQHACQNGDDGDYDQELDEREGLSP